VPKSEPGFLRPVMIAACLLSILSAFLIVAFAHDIPNDVTVQAFLKPEGQHLYFLARVPMKACRDVEFPMSPTGYLDITRAGAALRDAATLWLSDNLELYEEDARLPRPAVVNARVSLESEKTFESYEEALFHVNDAPLPGTTQLYWNQGMLDVLFEYPIESDQSRFSIRPDFSKLGIQVTTVVRLVLADGTIRAFEFSGDPGLVRLDPRWHQTALRFVGAGFMHILDGTDHLLFLFCLVIPFRRFRPLIAIVTAFTLAHSFTLIASAYNLGPDALWFPALIETLIAVSIVYMALENIVGSNVQRRWMIALGFGLVHGFGFSFALRQTLQFAGSHLLTSLLSFNIGVELGQLLVIALLVPLLEALFRFVVAERIGTIILSALIAHTGWHWMLERWGRLKQFGWPALNALQLASMIRWLMVMVFVAGLIWVISLFKVRARTSEERDRVVQRESELAKDAPLVIQSTANPHSN